MKTQMIVENVRVHIAERGVINQPNLSDVEFVYKGKVVKPDPKWIEEFEFTGLANIDFFISTDWDMVLADNYGEASETEIEELEEFEDESPSSLEEAVEYILPQLTTANIIDITHTKNDFGVYMCLDGMAIRNKWNLWRKSNLSEWFANHGIYHADDMSGVICKAVWAKVMNIKFDIKEEEEFFTSWWNKHGGIVEQRDMYYERCSEDE